MEVRGSPPFNGGQIVILVFFRDRAPKGKKRIELLAKRCIKQ